MARINTMTYDSSVRCAVDELLIQALRRSMSCSESGPIAASISIIPKNARAKLEGLVFRTIWLSGSNGL